jgi:hypothetical protein
MSTAICRSLGGIGSQDDFLPAKVLHARYLKLQRKIYIHLFLKSFKRLKSLNMFYSYNGAGWILGCVMCPCSAHAYEEGMMVAPRIVASWKRWIWRLHAHWQNTMKPPRICGRRFIPFYALGVENIEEAFTQYQWDRSSQEHFSLAIADIFASMIAAFWEFCSLTINFKLSLKGFWLITHF